MPVKALPILLAALGALASTAGVQASDKKALALVQELAALLPGEYNTTAQHDADVAGDVNPAHEALRLSIVHISAPLISENVLYVEERDAADGRRIFSQRIWVLVPGQKDAVVQLVYTLNEPLHWRGGATNPELFTAMILRDLTRETGCELQWKPVRDGFATTGDPGQCKVAARSGDGLWTRHSELRISPQELQHADHFFDADARAVPLPPADPVYHFRRAGN
ncbi:MAG: chromophore lyase CpcT/CpeT [Steroidobacteraceae bacterium]